MWTTHCLVGLCLGVVGAAVQREPWNTPIHWANFLSNFVLLPIYFTVYSAFGHGLRNISVVIAVVLLSQTAAFNLLYFVLYSEIDGDFVVTPVFLLVVYLALLVVASLLLRLVRRALVRKNSIGKY